VTLERGSGGIFQVFRQGQLVFDRRATGRFPDNGDIDTLVSRLGQ
jgi:predicted Rdx family selenoprotein